MSNFKLNKDLLPKEVYSTNEVKTNKVWIDKPIYKKTYIVQVSGNGSFNTNLSNIDKIWVDASNTFYNWSEYNWFLPIGYENGSNYFYTQIINNTGTVNYEGKASDYALNGKIYVVLNYTKTTD